MKVVLHHNASPGFRDELRKQAGSEFEVVVVDAEDVAGLRHEMKTAEALFHVLVPVKAEDMDGAPNLRLIQKIGVGVDTIDLEAARQRGVRVANMPGTNSQAVAEFTLLLMLGALRRVAYFDAKLRAGQGWTLPPETFDSLGEVHGKTVGLVGYGQVSQRVAPALRALGATVIYNDLEPSPNAPDDWRPLDEVLSKADVLSLHVPLTAQTAGMINAASINRMKRGLVLVNTARGGLVNETDLVQALRDGRVGAAGLDALAHEPVAPDNPLLSLNNVVLAPHIAWLTPETLSRSLTIAFDNCRRVARGDVLQYQIVPDARG